MAQTARQALPQAAMAEILFSVIGLAITLTVHFPINDQILAWSPQAAPAD